GASWFHYPESALGGCNVVPPANSSPCPIDDVDIDPTNPQNVYVAVDGNTVYYSHNGGQSFQAAFFPQAFVQGRQGIAVGPPFAAGLPGIVYTMVGARDGGAYHSLFVSTDGAVTWNPPSLLPPNVPCFTSDADQITIDGSDTSNFSQSFYDMAILVS